MIVKSGLVGKLIDPRGNIAVKLYPITPRPVRRLMTGAFVKMVQVAGTRPYYPGETTKSRARRLREGFFDKYIQGNGLDVGYGGDPVVPGVRGWDLEDGDAQYLHGLADKSFDFVYSSHTLEHMIDAEEAVRNWWRVVTPGGYLIIAVPDRDLYEKKRTLPSNFAPDHKHFFLPEHDEAPDTIGIVDLMRRIADDCDIVYVERCGEGHTIDNPKLHSDGEYQIEAVMRKRR